MKRNLNMKFNESLYRRGKARESERTLREYPIMPSTAWRERYCLRFVDILKRRKQKATLNFGKPKGKNYNLIIKNY